MNNKTNCHQIVLSDEFEVNRTSPDPLAQEARAHLRHAIAYLYGDQLSVALLQEKLDEVCNIDPDQNGRARTHMCDRDREYVRLGHTRVGDLERLDKECGSVGTWTIYDPEYGDLRLWAAAIRQSWQENPKRFFDQHHRARAEQIYDQLGGIRFSRVTKAVKRRQRRAEGNSQLPLFVPNRKRR